jgi:hypothetical protein
MLMNDRTIETEDGFLIDPFGAVPHDASRIVGLGGDQLSGEAGYAFRTLPIMPVPGPTMFVVTFHELQAGAGSISIDLTTTMAQEDSAPVKLATLVIPLADLVASGGSASLPFDARRNMLYAIAGYVHDDVAVSAREINVELRSASHEPQPAPSPVASSPNPDASSVVRVEPHRLTSLEAPDFRDPVSQPMTRDQCRHPDFRHWAEKLRGTGDIGADRLWPQAFVLQALNRYGLIRPGARGIGIGAVEATLRSQLEAMGCRVLNEDEDDYGRPLDFAWSSDMGGQRQDLERSVWTSIDRLAPGGMGVHVFGFSTHPRPGPASFGRADVERVALNLISFRHEIAQLKFRLPARDERSADATIPYGLIVRRT